MRFSICSFDDPRRVWSWTFATQEFSSGYRFAVVAGLLCSSLVALYMATPADVGWRWMNHETEARSINKEQERTLELAAQQTDSFTTSLPISVLYLFLVCAASMRSLPCCRIPVVLPALRRVKADAWLCVATPRNIAASFWHMGVLIVMFDHVCHSSHLHASIYRSCTCYYAVYGMRFQKSKGQIGGKTTGGLW